VVTNTLVIGKMENDMEMEHISTVMVTSMMENGEMMNAMERVQ
jgi:hypothetical protein